MESAADAEPDAATGPGATTGPDATTGRGRGRGRPSIVDVGAVSEAAFLLWSDRGYAETGWKELAEATGVSARTLMRHFGTRDRIAWAGVEAANERLEQAIAELRAEPDPAVAVRRAIVASVSHDEHVARSAAAWFRLIAAEPELVATAAAANRLWTARLAAHLAERLPGATPAVCAALAAAYEAATFAALSAWAEGGVPGDPADAVDAALAWIRLAR